MQKPQNSFLEKKDDVMMEEESHPHDLSLFSDEDDVFDNFFEPDSYQFKKDESEEDFMKLDDSYDEMLDYDPYDLPTEKRPKHVDNVQFIANSIETFKENIKPMMGESYHNDCYEWPAFLQTRLDINELSGKEKDKYIEENALMDISNKHNSSALCSKFNSNVLAKNVAKR